MAFLKALWRGEISLVFTYWVMGTLVTFIFRAYEAYLWESGRFMFATGEQLIFPSILTALQTGYLAFILICIWRSADKYIAEARTGYGRFKKNALWGYLARVSVGFGWLGVAATVTGLGQV
jgi:hypothetical protein